MQVKVCGSVLQLVQGDITKEHTEAIVNAANRTLLGGGGVDGAIHKAAGPQLLEECRRLGGCNTGDAVITKGYGLKARYVIHTVGPVYRGANPRTQRLLQSAYRRSLEVALEHGIRSISFPSISTGAYGYPLEEAAPVALKTVIDFLKEQKGIALVRFVLYGEKAYGAYEKALQRLMRTEGLPTTSS
jgi:O-acetyl-ADP-ribose deacetylase (regulator of RNase III)